MPTRQPSGRMSCHQTADENRKKSAVFAESASALCSRQEAAPPDPCSVSPASAMSSSSSSGDQPQLLCRVDFPAYCIVAATRRHLLLGGGGGAAKTGVRNGFEVLELGHDGRNTTAASVTRADTGEFAVMNAAAAQYDAEAQRLVVAAGHDAHCQLYQLQMTTDKTSSETCTLSLIR